MIDEQPEELWRAVSAYSCTGATAQKRPAPAQPLQYGHHMRGGRTGPITKAAITDTVGNGYLPYLRKDGVYGENNAQLYWYAGS